MSRKLLAASLTAATLAAPAVQAEQLAPVRDRDRFVSLIDGRDLTRMGIRLQVTPGGEIRGRGFGRPVSGAWRWQGGYFCRDLYWGQRDLGPNCQEVRASGDTIRFTSDKGSGQSADFSLE